MKNCEIKDGLLLRPTGAWKKLTFLEKIGFLLCVFVLGALTVYIFAGMPANLTSDSANHAVLAEEMHVTGQLIPRDWNSRKDIYLLGPQNILAILTLFSDNQVGMLSVTCFLHLIAVFAVFVYFSGVVSGNRCWLIFTPLLLCGISEDFMRIVFDQISYILPMIFIFLVLAMYMDSVEDGRKVRSGMKYVLCLLLMIVLTAQGVRYIQAIILPLMGTVVLLFLFEYGNEVPGEVVRKKDFRYTLMHITALVAVLVLGLILFKVCGQMHNYLPSKDLSKFSSDFGATLLNFYDKLIQLMGIEQGCSLFSVRGILNLIKLCGGILLLLVLPVLQIRKFETESHEMKFFTLFTCIHVAEILILSLFCEALEAVRYLYTSMFLLYYLSAHYIKQYLFTPEGTVKGLLAALGISLFVIPVSAPKALSVFWGKEALEEAKGLTEYLQEQELTYGYATTFNSVVHTVYSDFEVRIHKVGLSPVERIRRNNSDRAYFEETYQGETFILTKGEREYEKYLSSDSYVLFGEPCRTETFQDYTIFIYDYNVANNDFGGK